MCGCKLGTVELFGRILCAFGREGNKEFARPVARVEKKVLKEIEPRSWRRWILEGFLNLKTSGINFKVTSFSETNAKVLP
jgi:hypothetical protein